MTEHSQRGRRKTHSFIHSEIFLENLYVPGTLLNAEDTMANETEAPNSWCM